MEDQPRVKRPYKRINKEVVARHIAETAIQGNGTRAVEVLEPDYINPSSRAHDIASKSKELTTAQYVDHKFEQISREAIEKVQAVVNSTDTPQALKASIFVLEQERGKAIQRTQNINVSATIQDVLG